MSDQGIKSRPQYGPLQLDPTGTRHLLLVAEPTYRAETLGDGDEVEIWRVVPREAEGVAGIAEHRKTSRRNFRSVQHLLDSLAPRLAQETMGLRIYAAGREDFLWDVNGVAKAAGMDKQEVFLTHAGSRKRRVYCVHCRTYNPDVTTTIARCQGCGANLFVRDHFSRRLSAFMGVKVDAEAPGDVPAAQEAYS